MVSREREIKLNIGGIGISLKWEGMKLRRWPHPFYRNFLSDGGAEISLQIFKDQPPSFLKEKMIFDGQDNLWKLYQANGKYIFEIFSPVPPHPTSKIAFMDSNFSLGEVYICPNVNIQTSWSPVDVILPLVQILIINRLSLNQGILVHAMGVSEQGKGMVFIGPSGAGKTTLAELYKMREGETSIINDEHLIIRKTRNQFLVFGTPWPSLALVASSKVLPIDKIFFIQPAKENITSPLVEVSSFFSNLFPQLFLPFWDKEKLNLTINFCEELMRNIPCYTLGFVKDKSVVDFIRRI